MARPPLDVREWLEDMRRFNSRDADRATELLAVLDHVEDPKYDEELMLTDVAERTGNHTLDTMDDLVRVVTDMKHLEIWTEQDEMMAGFAGNTTLERLKLAVAHATRLEAQSFALSELCMAAGIIAKNDYTTDPLPLLAMFLPVD